MSNLLLSQHVLDFLKKSARNTPYAWLVGSKDHVFNIIQSGDVSQSFIDIRRMVPWGLSVLGFYLPDQSAASKFAVEEAKLVELVEEFLEHPVVFLCSGADGQPNAFAYNQRTLEPITCEQDPASPDLGQKAVFRLQFRRVVYSNMMTHLQDTITSPQASFLINSPKKDHGGVIIDSSELINSGGLVGQPCSDLLNGTNTTTSSVADRFVLVSVLSDVSQPPSLLATSDCSHVNTPMLQYTEGARGTPITVEVDVLSYHSLDDSIGSVVKALKMAAFAQIQHIYQLVEESKDENGFNQITANHFEPPQLPHPVTILYLTKSSNSEKENEATLVNRRTIYHKCLLLPHQPLLRSSNRIPLTHPKYDRLLNVHSTLGDSGVAGGTRACVKGDYLYYHYCQDKFDDDGWGCAYRTFMTICSWYLIQKYTTVPVPDHREIQTALVEMGEKPRSLIGSKQWLGSLDLGMALDQIYGFAGKIMPVNSGAEIPTKARQLLEHFQTEGTPVMIGGGQLAYGLLGVDFNEKTGQFKLLILDPHYIGAEHIPTIHNKKWCAWRDPDLFIQTAFYNFCLPQRPKMI